MHDCTEARFGDLECTGCTKFSNLFQLMPLTEMHTTLYRLGGLECTGCTKSTPHVLVDASAWWPMHMQKCLLYWRLGGLECTT